MVANCSRFWRAYRYDQDVLVAIMGAATKPGQDCCQSVTQTGSPTALTQQGLWAVMALFSSMRSLNMKLKIHPRGF
jgi:hypothetical protein